MVARRAAWTTLQAVLAVGLIFLLGYRYLLWDRAFNSDDLYCSALAADVLQGRPLCGWFLPGAPYLFPDLLLNLPCRALAPNLVGEFLGYCLAFWLAVLAVLFWIARELRVPARRAFAAAAVGVSYLAAAFLGRSDFNSALMAHAGSHTGVVLTGLILLALTLRTVRRGSWGLASAGMYVLAGGLGAFSDKLLIVQFLAPTAGALLLLSLLHRLTWRQLLVHLALLLGAGAVFLAIRMLLMALGFHLLSAELGFPPASPATFLEGLSRLRTELSPYPLLGAVVPLYLLLIGLVLARSWRRRTGSERDGDEYVCRAQAVLGVVLVLGPICNLLALLLGGAPVASRYTLSCWLLPSLLAPLLAALVGWPRGHVAGSATAAVLGLYAITSAVALVPEVQLQRLQVPYPSLARMLDRLAAERGPIRGLGGYWLGRHLTMLARGPVTVNTVAGSGSPWFHGDNPDRYLEDERPLHVPEYTFAIVDRGEEGPDWGMDPQTLLAYYGAPAQRLSTDCRGREIWLYHPMASGLLDAFQRARWAERVRRMRSYQAPRSPECMAKPRPNLAPVAGCICLAPGKTVDISFAHPVHGAVLDLAAGYLDTFRFQFFRGSREVGVLAVPPVPWTGAACAYGPPGLQARLLPVPDSLRRAGWDRIVAQALSPACHAHLGHLLVLDEPLPGLPRAVTPGRRWRYEAESLPTQLDAARSRRSDPQASGQAVRCAAAGKEGLVCFGPFITLPPGRYRVEFALKAAAKHGSGPLASIDVVASPECTKQASRVLYEHDPRSSDGWACPELTFETECELYCVEFWVHTSGAAELNVDYVEVTALPRSHP